MKLPKEYTMIIIIGLFLLAYLLDVLVDPLRYIMEETSGRHLPLFQRHLSLLY